MKRKSAIDQFISPGTTVGYHTVCCEGPSTMSTVIRVDKTFNLSQLHVIITAFKNLPVYEKVPVEHPIMLGPIFLHGNSDFDTFLLFFSHRNQDSYMAL